MQRIGSNASPRGRIMAIALAMCLTMGFANPAISGDWEDAEAAFNSGDYDTALRLLTSLSEQGYEKAQHNLAWMYLEGLGTAKNEATAFEWYMASAKQGYAPAQLAIGNLFENGVGVPEDDAKAAEWYGYAADQFFPYAQHNLALMYKEGRGVPKDLVLAYMWMLIASANLEESRDDLDEIRDALTPEQVEQGRQMVADWVEAHQN